MKTHPRLLLPFLTVTLLATAATTRALDWPNWRGPDLNGISRETGWTTRWPKEGPPQLWKAQVGIGFSSVAVARGRLFTIGNVDGTDTVFALDAETGKELWKHSYLCPIDPTYYEGGPGSTPTVDGGDVYTLSKHGHLFRFHAEDGKVIWQKNLMEELGVAKPRWGFSSSPLVQGGLLLLNVGSAGTAVEKADGKIAWTSGREASGYATLTPFDIGGEPSVAIFTAKALTGVRIKDGTALWRHPWLTKWDINICTPILINGGLFISSFDCGSALLRLGASEPTVVWENRNIANHFNSCILLDGHLYGVHGNTDQAERDLRCLDARTGELKWKHEGLGLGSLLAADGKLIVLSDKGELVVAPVSPTGFHPQAQAQVMGGKCWTVPVLANGRIYCRNAQGVLICLDVRSK